jgi:hypothetical protein
MYAGMSVTTLEEVFIKVAHFTNTQAEAEAGRISKGQLSLQFKMWRKMQSTGTVKRVCSALGFG